jgi:asparagine synthase (glutamine-hydrolysing)
MCGFSGFFSSDTSIANDAKSILAKMNDVIEHRGPDSSGLWVNDDRTIGLGHRRLSILDVSDLGNQPMSLPERKLTIVYNGEIYNHLRLREELEATNKVKWISNSDTETLLQCISCWGIDHTLSKATGMFSFALVNEISNIIYLARDRFGEKPLYLYKSKSSNCFVFGSDLSSFKVFPKFEKTIDRNAISLFLRHNYIPSPYTIYENVTKVFPGTIVEINLANRTTVSRKYWSAPEAINNSLSNPFKGQFSEAVDQLDGLMKRVVSGQMISDVPLGAFLSGGIDSSAIVAMMQSLSSKPIKTFSIGFDDSEFNESEYARKVASYLGTDHTEYIVTEREALNTIPTLNKVFTEPFADSSQIPTILVSRLAKTKVTVSLSGDAGDELFGGYNRYLYASRMYNQMKKVPKPVKYMIKSLIKGVDPAIWNKMLPFARINNIGEKLHKFSDVINMHDSMQLYIKMISHFDHPAELVYGGTEPKTLLTGYANLSSLDHLDDISKMMAYDTITYLPDDILVKVDRSSMYSSLESRVPFLDHRVFDFAWSLPMDYKVKNGIGKRVLREMLFRYVPQEIFNRPKMGFGIPLSKWLRGSLREWVEDTLSYDSLKKYGVLNPHHIRILVDNHMTKKEDNGYKIWDLLMIQSWLNENS